jgi:endonuclease G
LPDFLADFDTYLLPLDLLEQGTGLAFRSLREHASPAALQWRAGPVLVQNAEQVNW